MDLNYKEISNLNERNYKKLLKNYKQIIIADKTIYSGKEDSHPGTQLPLYINE
mgnify:CR=1 FL=1